MVSRDEDAETPYAEFLRLAEAHVDAWKAAYDARKAYDDAGKAAYDARKAYDDAGKAAYDAWKRAESKYPALAGHVR